VAHPRANGQVEHTNGLILDGLKKRLYDENNKKCSKWINEISSVAWGLRTQPSKAIRVGSYITSWYDVEVSTTGNIWRRQGWYCKTSRVWLSRGNPMQRIVLVGQLLTRSSSSPRETFNDALTVLEIWFFDESRMILGYISLIHGGRIFYCAQGYGPWILSLTVPWWSGGIKFLEYWASTSFSSLINWGHLLLMPGDGYFHYNSILPVYDWYYAQVCWRGLSPYFQ
jgi:hypothetical protein